MARPCIGIVGAGQLGRMMALAAYPLGVAVRFLDRAADSPGGQIGPIRTAALDDADALAALAAEVDVLTFDIENVPGDVLRELGRQTSVQPGADAVVTAQDRLAEKELFAELDIATAPYVRVDSEADLDTAAARLGLPVVLKARREGYDGRGQRIVGSSAGLADAWRSLGQVPAIAEGRVAFDRELSLIAVQGIEGQRVYYGLAENRHEDGILVRTTAPYDDADLQREAERHAAAILERFDYRGALAIEFFETEGRLVANEIAPRVHNSGHWTIEGAETSQFENHVRAILGWPLGSTEARGHAAMLNLLGSLPDKPRVLSVAGAHLHDYGKAPRPARKVGHVTIVDRDRERLERRVAALRDACRPSCGPE